MANEAYHRASGDNVRVVAPAGGFTKGKLYKIGDLIGVATADVAAGGWGHLLVKGEFDFPNADGEAFTAGDRCYLAEIPVGETNAGDLYPTTELGVGEFFAVCTQDASVSDSKVRGVLIGPAADTMLREFSAMYEPDIAEGEGDIGAHAFGPSFPDDAIILEAFVKPTETATSATDAATIAVSLESADDVVAAIAISDASDPWDAGDGLKATVPDRALANAAGPVSGGPKQLNATVAVENLTAGGFVVFGTYVVVS